MFTGAFLALIATAVAITVSITQAVKKKLGLKGAGAVILSLVVAAMVCLFHEVQAGFNLWRYIIFTLAVWIQANGWYDFAEQMAEKRR